MPCRSKLDLPEIDLGEETFGERLSRLRKARGYTQVEHAERMGIIQTLISNYEKDKLRPAARWSPASPSPSKSPAMSCWD